SISNEINNRMINLGYGASDDWGNKGYFDPTILKFLLEQMSIEAGVIILYYTFALDVIKNNEDVKGVVVVNKGGLYAIFAKRIIDCTGDADIAFKAGVPFESGNPLTGKNQAISLRYIMSGIDIHRFHKYLKSIGDTYEYKPPLFHVAMIWGHNMPLESVFKKAYEANDLKYEDGQYWQVFGIPGRADSLAFNCPEIFERIDGTNPFDLTNAQIEGKKAILRHIKFYKKYFPGFENCYLAEVAVQVGVRETRRIIGQYVLKNEDVLLCKKFEDFIVKSNYQIDVHGVNNKYDNIDISQKDKVPYYEIPYRCLIPINVKKLLVAGRCISAEFFAQSSLRIQPTVRAIGEAAGIASAISIKQNKELFDIYGKEIREEMIKRGADFQS
ncbi:MAG: FAD-dependent oxidoreductase, partial [Thermoanaerobacterium sp.]|nr:FAD-dependent oxidoreductase [Thermoanaerobacterium sp.]